MKRGRERAVVPPRCVVQERGPGSGSGCHHAGLSFTERASFPKHQSRKSVADAERKERRVSTSLGRPTCRIEEGKSGREGAVSGLRSGDEWKLSA